jgi:hypothetical protein
MNCKKCARRWKPGERVEVRNVPWKGVIGTYIGPARMFGSHRAGWIGPHQHLVELGDFLSGGSPRRVKVTHIEKVEEAPS